MQKLKMKAGAIWKEPNIVRLTEMLYLAVAAGFVLKLSFDTALFHVSWPAEYEKVMQILACVVLFLRVGFTQAYAGKEWLVCILTGIMFKLSWVSTEYAFLLDTALLIAGAVGIPYKKILKAGFWTQLYVLVLAMLGSFTGCIPDLVYSSEEGFRHSFGIVYTTDFATHVVFLFLTGWILFENIPIVFQITCTAFLAFLIYYYCRARCNTIILCLFLVGILYFVFTEKYKSRNRGGGIFTKLIDHILICTMPIGILLINYLTFLFEQGNTAANHINTKLNGRFRLGLNAINAYGVKPFGTAFVLVGAGGSTGNHPDYNFVDISYLLILVRYGFTILLSICLLNLWLQKKAIRAGQRKIVIVAALIAVHSMIEHHLPELAYNLLLLLPFADFSVAAEKSISTRSKKEKYIAYPIAFVFAAIAVLSFPRFVSYLKTIVETLQMNVPENHIWFLIMVTVGMLAVGLFLKSIFRFIRIFAEKKRFHAGYCAGIVMLFMAFLGTAIRGEEIISHAQEEYESVLETDRDIIEALSDAEQDTGRLYVDHVPEVYRREFGNAVSDSVLAPEGAATRKNATLIADEEPSLGVLIKAGYQYGEIAPGRIVYTNSEEAQKVLEKTGILFK